MDCKVQLPTPQKNVENLARVYNLADKGQTISPFDHPDTLQRMGHSFNPEGQVAGLWRLCAVIVSKRKMQGLDK